MALLSKEELSKLPDDGSGSGVYFLWAGDVINYIGSTKNLNYRIYMHRSSWRFRNMGGSYNVCVPHDRATCLNVDAGVMKDVEYQYIRELQPAFNKNGR